MNGQVLFINLVDRSYVQTGINKSVREWVAQVFDPETNHFYRINNPNQLDISLGIGLFLLSDGNVLALGVNGIVGAYMSITIGVDGLPIISYFDEPNGDLKVAHCDDVACASATATTLDRAGNVGEYSSITIGADGLPIISYLDASNRNLKVAHCDDIACTSATATTLDRVGNVGQDSSITIGADGLPIISYYDFTNAYLKVAHCDDVACTSATYVTLDRVAEVFNPGTGTWSILEISKCAISGPGALMLANENLLLSVVGAIDYTCWPQLEDLPYLTEEDAYSSVSGRDVTLLENGNLLWVSPTFLIEYDIRARRVVFEMKINGSRQDLSVGSTGLENPQLFVVPLVDGRAMVMRDRGSGSLWLYYPVR
jgi:hypothetical protein